MSCPHNTALLYLLLLICMGLVGLILGLILALIVQRICNRWWIYKQRERQMHQEAALAQLEQQREEIDPAMDERMLCPVCWQEQHPGMHFPLPDLRLCHDHAHWQKRENVSSAVWREQLSIQRSSVVVERAGS